MTFTPIESILLQSVGHGPITVSFEELLDSSLTLDELRGFSTNVLLELSDELLTVFSEELL